MSFAPGARKFSGQTQEEPTHSVSAASEPYEEDQIMDDKICCVCGKKFPANAPGSRTNDAGHGCPKCVEKILATFDGSEGPGDGGV